MYSMFSVIEDAGPVAEIVLNRPEKHNALAPAFWHEFPDALKKLDADTSTRAIVISSVGQNFSAGMDLSFFDGVYAKQTEESGRFREWLRREILRLQQAITTMEEIRVPVIAVTQGACIGGALDLVCAANIRVATADAYFSIHEINVGMTADLGTLQRLPTLVPLGVAQEMALTGMHMNAQAALGYGLVTHVLQTHEDAMARARKIAKEISAKSPLAIAGTKVALNYSRDHSVQDGLQHIAQWNAGMFISEDLTLGIEAQRKEKTADYKDTLSL